MTTRFLFLAMAALAGFLPAGVVAAEQKFANSIGLKLVQIPAGEFRQGSSPDDKTADGDEHPSRRVTLSRPFFIGVYEVTQDEFQHIMGENPSWFSPTGPGRDAVVDRPTGRYPVDMVSWRDAVEFCRRLTNRAEERAARRIYRLPTEAEWEYAARGGAVTAFTTGDTLSPRDANIFEGAKSVDGRLQGATRPVGEYRPNGFGLYDVHGNVWEWCADWYAAGYDEGPVTDPRGPDSGTGRVVRGGDWRHAASFARLANRDFTRATRRDLGNGFRVVCEIDPESGK